MSDYPPCRLTSAPPYAERVNMQRKEGTMCRSGGFSPSPEVLAQRIEHLTFSFSFTQSGAHQRSLLHFHALSPAEKSLNRESIVIHRGIGEQ